MKFPKDGKIYGCWHRHIGFVSVTWNETLKVFHCSIYAAISVYSQYDESDLIRWMDEKGNWHEVTE